MKKWEFRNPQTKDCGNLKYVIIKTLSTFLFILIKKIIRKQKYGKIWKRTF